MAAKIKLIIADDHEIFRKGIEWLLKGQSEFSIIGEAENGQDLIKMATASTPDIILTDIQMPIISGIEATSLLTDQFPKIGVIALTMHNEEHLLYNMIQAGAKGYLLKDTSKQELLQAIKYVYSGRTYYSSPVYQRMRKIIQKEKGEISFGHLLNQREVEIVKMICLEQPSKEIASHLGYSKRTVENYRERIQQKIGAKNMAGIVLYAIRHKLFLWQ